VQRIEFGKWSVLSDPDLTREAYALMEDGGAECCGCELCFNFATSRHLVYPTEILDFLDWLGVDPQLEAEVRHDRCDAPGRHSYTACFYLVGRVESGPATTCARSAFGDAPSLEATDDDVSMGFSMDAREAPEVFRGLPVVRLEVAVVAPWVSNAPEPPLA
jgi:hypothetical protein